MFQELDKVRTKIDIPDSPIKAGSLGVIVHVFPVGAFEVEFYDEMGITITTYPHLPEQMELVK